MHGKRPLWGGLRRRLDIPQEALPGGFGLTMSGQRALTVQGCRRILSYSSSCICLAVGRKTVLFVEGEALLCTVFQAGGVTVEGVITVLRVEKGDGENGT